MIYIVCPANVSRYFELVKPIVVYDFLPSESISNIIWKFDHETQRKYQSDILDQMEDLGYSSHVSILILGSLWIYIGLYFVQWVFFLTYNYFHNTFFISKDLEGGDNDSKATSYSGTINRLHAKLTKDYDKRLDELIQNSVNS